MNIKLNLSEIFKNKLLKKQKNILPFVPRKTLSVEIDGKRFYVSVVCDDYYTVKVVLLNEENDIIYTIKEMDGDRTDIAKINNNLYIFEKKYAHIYDINNLSNNPKTININGLGIQGICSNKKSIYAYSITFDRIIECDSDLNPIKHYNNVYSSGNHRMPVELTCNDTTIFSIPIELTDEEQYYLVKEFMTKYLGPKISIENDMINSCSYNNTENTLYICMYNIIFVIKDTLDIGYLYFKNSAITSAFYDNDINQLIVNFSDRKGEGMCGSIEKLSNDEIKNKTIHLDNIASPFKSYSNEIDTDDNVKQYTYKLR